VATVSGTLPAAGTYSLRATDAYGVTAVPEMSVEILKTPDPDPTTPVDPTDPNGPGTPTPGDIASSSDGLAHTGAAADVMGGAALLFVAIGAVALGLRRRWTR
jgi:hypothetical protein